MPATIDSSTPKSIYPYSGKNFAPLEPLERMAMQSPVTSPNKLCESLRIKYDTYMNADDQAWREHMDIGRMVANKRVGKLMLLRNVMTGAFMFVKPDTRWEDRKALGGVVQFYSSKLSAGWMSSRPEIDPLCPSDQDQIEEYIQDVKIIQDHYSTKFFDDDYEYAESLSAQDYGTWVTRFRYDPDKQEIICELLELPACRWDIRRTAEESDYFIYHSKCSNAWLERLLKSDIAPDGDADEKAYGLRLVEQIARQGGNVVGEGKNRLWGNTENDIPENTVVEMWLQPEAYCDIDLTADEATLSGTELKAGQSLIETFPKGMCVVGINNMQTIIGLYAEDHKDHIVSGRYHTQSFCGLGKGISDIIDTSKEMDDMFSQILAYVKGHAMPSWGFNSAVVTEDKVKQIGQGRKALALDFSQAPEANSINDVIQHLVPGDPGNAAFDMMDRLNDNIQIASQVTNFTNSFPGVDNKTATGAKLGTDMAAMLLVPQLRNKASHRKRAFKVIFNLFKRFMDKEVFFATKTPNGITAGKYLTGTQFNDVDIEFEVVSNSEMPQTPLMQRESLGNLFQFTGGLPGLMQAAQMDPDLVSEIASIYGAKLPIPKKNDIARVCRRRIEQAKQILEAELSNQRIMAAVGLPADNTNLAGAIVDQLSPPVSPQERYSQQKAEWLMDLLDSDELQYAPVELRYVVEELIKRQLGAAVIGDAQLQSVQQLGNVMSNMPQLLGQQAMSEQNQQMAQQFQMQQMQQQAQQQAQVAQQQLQMEGMKAEVTEAQEQANHDRAIEMSDRQYQQQAALQRAAA